MPRPYETDTATPTRTEPAATKSYQQASRLCRCCGDFTLDGWEELLHLPNQRCPGLRDPSLVELVVVVPKREFVSLARRALLNTAP